MAETTLLPILERIVLNIVETLEGVSTAAAMNQTLTVQRPDLAHGNVVEDALAVVTLGEAQRVEDDAYNCVRWLQPVIVVLSVVESDASDLTIDERLAVIVADVQTAMMADPHRGGIAIDTTPEEPFYPDPESAGANIGEVWAIFTVDYRTPIIDPYTIA